MGGRVTPSGVPKYHGGRVQHGMSPTARAHQVQMKRKKKKSGKQFKNLVLVIIIAFIFLFTPAQEHVNKQFSIWLGDFWKSIGPSHEYPTHTEYTLERTVEIENFDSGERQFLYRLPIPIQRTNRGIEDTTFERNGVSDMAMNLQWVKSMKVGSSFSHIPVPVMTVEYLEESSAISLGDGYSSVHWPTLGASGDRCEYTRCLVWKGDIPANSIAILTVTYEISSSTYSWTSGETISTPITGTALGMDISNSGSFSDLSRSGWVGATTSLIGEEHQWYDRNEGGSIENWAIDGDHHLVKSAADNIQASLPLEDQDNIFAFSHAAFIYVRDNVEYGPGAAYPPRNGPTCLAQGIGDCDEQANAWMSILRVKNIPTWYEFGALTSMNHEIWEAHAWSVILIPYNNAWCDENGIDLDSCYLEGSVDVVNNKWLLHTPTAFSEFLEPYSPQGIAPDEFYKVMSINAYEYNWVENWDTVVGPDHLGPTFKVPYVTGE